MQLLYQYESLKVQDNSQAYIAPRMCNILYAAAQ